MDALTEQEHVALRFLAHSLIQIRLLTRDLKRPLTAEVQRAIHDLADAWHNVPAVVADRSDKSSLIDGGIQEASAVYAREGWANYFTK